VKFALPSVSFCKTFIPEESVRAGRAQYEPTSKFATETRAEVTARMVAPIKEPG